MTGIGERQNDPAQIQLLRSRRQTYYEAKWLLGLQLLLTVVVPVVGSVVAIFHPGAAPYTAALGLLVIVVDAAFLDRPLQRRLLRAARIAEMFDTRVLDMRWNPAFAGNQIDVETLAGLDRGFVARGQGDEKLLDWYSPKADSTALHLARILCQLANPWYDGRLRGIYASVILAASLLIALALFAFGISMNLTVPQFCGSVIATLTPLFTWSLREYFRQSDAAGRTDEIRTALLELWGRAREHTISPEECSDGSRTIQDAIFIHRATAPLAIPFVYDAVRSSMESSMHEAIEDRLAEIASLRADEVGRPG